MPPQTNGRHAPKSSPVSKGKADAKKSFRKRASDAPSWNDVTPALIHAIVCACAVSNAPPTFGYTRDGTALTIAVYYDGERYVDYLADTDEVAAYLDWLLDELLSLSQDEIANYRQARL